MKVIALNRIQRSDENGQRQVIPPGAVFEIDEESDQYTALKNHGAIRKAKESEEVKAREDGLVPVMRRERLRTRRELRAIRDAEQDAAMRREDFARVQASKDQENLNKPKGKGRKDIV